MYKKREIERQIIPYYTLVKKRRAERKIIYKQVALGVIMLSALILTFLGNWYDKIHTITIMREQIAKETNASTQKLELTFEEANSIQVQLMQASHMDPMEWIALYSNEFRTYIESEDARDFILKYKSNPNMSLDYLADLLKKRVLH